MCKQFYHQYLIRQQFKLIRNDILIFHIPNERKSSIPALKKDKNKKILQSEVAKILMYFKTLQLFFSYKAMMDKRDMLYNKGLKKMGMKEGISDYFVIVPKDNGLFLVAFIEFKRDKNSKLSDSQKVFATLCASLGIRYLLTWEIEKAFEFIAGL